MRRRSRQLLTEIERELQRLERDRDALDREISRLRQAAAGLRQREASEPTSAQSLTNACRAALRTYPDGVSPLEVRQELTRHAFEWSGFSNPLSAIHTVLKRLVKQGEASTRVGDDGRKRFVWKARAPLIVRPTQAEEAARIEHLLDGTVSNEEFGKMLDRWTVLYKLHRASVDTRRKPVARPRSRRP